MGDHGLTIMAAREHLGLEDSIKSDSAPLNDLVAAVMAACPDVHVLRDPTRGGLATTLNEIAQQSGVGIVLEDQAIPVHPEVSGGCSFLGLDPLYLANEGKCIVMVPEGQAEDALTAMRGSPYGSEAAIVGRVVPEDNSKVILKTRIGGERILGMLEGALLPRIC